LINPHALKKGELRMTPAALDKILKRESADQDDNNAIPSPLRGVSYPFFLYFEVNAWNFDHFMEKKLAL